MPQTGKMVDDWVIKTMYATKRRRRNNKSMKSAPRESTKTNPSKRHRERLNSELDNVAKLLPYDQTIISKLDKLSILRLSVSYMRMKSLFSSFSQQRYVTVDGQKYVAKYDPPIQINNGLLERDAIMQALNGFLFIVTTDGEVYFASESVEEYLGFHQSDIIHQSVLELIHSQDRDDFTEHLQWNSSIKKGLSNNRDVSLSQAVAEDHECLRRSFTSRFRCLLDNTSGFITLEIYGRIAPLYSEMRGSQFSERAPLALFATCSPFGPLPLLESPSHGFTFKSKHKLDMTPVAFDQNGRLLLNVDDTVVESLRGYDLIHPLDADYFATAHRELVKTGSAGLVAYRMLVVSGTGTYVWLQTGARVVYKNSKPDCIICTHRQLTDEEGTTLLTKRSVEFKLPYPLLESDVGDDLSLASPTQKAAAAAATTVVSSGGTASTSKKSKRHRNSSTTCKEAANLSSPKRKRFINCRDAITDLAYYYYPALGAYGMNYPNELYYQSAVGASAVAALGYDQTLATGASYPDYSSSAASVAAVGYPGAECYSTDALRLQQKYKYFYGVDSYKFDFNQYAAASSDFRKIPQDIDATQSIAAAGYTKQATGDLFKRDGIPGMNSASEQLSQFAAAGEASAAAAVGATGVVGSTIVPSNLDLLRDQTSQLLTQAQSQVTTSEMSIGDFCTNSLLQTVSTLGNFGEDAVSSSAFTEGVAESAASGVGSSYVPASVIRGVNQSTTAPMTNSAATTFWPVVPVTNCYDVSSVAAKSAASLDESATISAPVVSDSAESSTVEALKRVSVLKNWAEQTGKLDAVPLQDSWSAYLGGNSAAAGATAGFRYDMSGAGAATVNGAVGAQFDMNAHQQKVEKVDNETADGAESQNGHEGERAAEDVSVEEGSVGTEDDQKSRKSSITSQASSMNDVLKGDEKTPAAGGLPPRPPSSSMSQQSVSQDEPKPTLLELARMTPP